MLRSTLLAGLLAISSRAAPSSPAVSVLAKRGPIYKEATSPKTDGKLRYVENSGICETT